MENQLTYTSPESMGLPPGYRFCPSKKQLIEYYLIKKITGKPIPRNPVKDCDVYGDPGIWRELFEESGMKTHYFYTSLKNKKRGTKMERTTKFGTWDNNNKSLIYDDDDDEEEHDDFNERGRKHIGLRTTFALKNSSEHNAKWTMHEYKLDGIYKNMQNKDEYVLCQINKIIKKRRVAKDNSHQNIQDKRAKPLELMGSALENSDRIESSQQNIQDDGAQPLNKDVLGELVSNSQCHWVTKDNSHQNIQDECAQPLQLMGSAVENSDRIESSHQNMQDEGAQDRVVWGDMDTCPSPNIFNGNWPLDTNYSQDISMDSANGDSEWSESLWEFRA